MLGWQYGKLKNSSQRLATRLTDRTTVKAPLYTQVVGITSSTRYWQHSISDNYHDINVLSADLAHLVKTDLCMHRTQKNFVFVDFGL
jgi:hypothetical protein